MLKIYLNGSLVPKDQAKVSVFDHGFLYGDGVFEGIRAYNGRVWKLDEHLERLYQSAKVIMLNIPLSVDEMKEAVLETLRANNLSDAYIRLVVSRGDGDLGLDPRKCPHPNLVIIADKIVLFPQELYRTGMKVISVPTRRNLNEAVNPRVKSLNYLNSIMAKIEANHLGYPEVILLNQEGYVVEGSGDNIFIIKKGVLYTPPVYAGILEGITRNTIMEIARGLGITVREELFSRHDLYVADECFLTGTAAEAIPVIEIDGRSVGKGVPGEITWKLIKVFRDMTQREGTPVYRDAAQAEAAAAGRSA